MTDEQWSVLDQLFAEGWSAPREWTAATAGAYRLVLDGYDADQVLLAVQRLIQRGGAFRPSIAEVVAALNADPDLPSWAEANSTIMDIAYADGLRAAGLPAPSREPAHEVIELFVAAQGSRLQMLPLNDLDWGHVERKRLGDEYEAFVQRYQERKREGRALEALGRSRRGELGKPDWRALTAKASPTGELATGDRDAEAHQSPEGAAEPGRRSSAGRLRRPDPLAGPAAEGGDGAGEGGRGGAQPDGTAAGGKEGE
jgi:hypothetical protein